MLLQAAKELEDRISCQLVPFVLKLPSRSSTFPPVLVHPHKKCSVKNSILAIIFSMKILSAWKAQVAAAPCLTKMATQRGLPSLCKSLPQVVVFSTFCWEMALSQKTSAKSSWDRWCEVFIICISRALFTETLRSKTSFSTLSRKSSLLTLACLNKLKAIVVMVSFTVRGGQAITWPQRSWAKRHIMACLQISSHLGSPFSSWDLPILLLLKPAQKTRHSCY